MPEWKGELRRRLAELRLPPAREAEIIEEVSQHLEESGTEDVDLAALVRELGAIERPRIEPLETGAGGARGILARSMQDVRYGARALRQRPAFTAVAALTLALGIGAVTTLFSAVRGVLLRPLPYADPGALASFWLSAPEKGLPEVSLPDGLFVWYRERSRSFLEMAAYSAGGVILTGVGEPERLSASAVSHEFFHVLGVRPLLGRGFVAAEEVPGAAPAAVIGYGLWQRRFGGDSSVIGRSISFADIPTTIVGVMPRGFDYPNHADAWAPLTLDRSRTSPWYLDTVARLRPGVTAEEAAREIGALTDDFKNTRLDRFTEADRSGKSLAVAKRLLDTVVGDVRTPLLLLLGAVALVMLIACANVATLLLARAGARSREMALRCCLGASTRRVAAQMLTESLLLALLGGGAGLLLAAWMVPALRHLAPAQFPRLELVRIEPPVLLFGVAVTLITGVLFGLVPALSASRVNLGDVLNEGARGSASGGTRRWNDAFVVGQFALSLMLLIGAGLLLRSFQRLVAVDPGFRSDRVLLARISLPGRRYRDQAQVRAFYGRLLERVRALPGVGEVGLANRVPLSRGNPQNEFVVEGHEPAAGDPIPVANMRNVTPGYFSAIGTTVLRGRAFAASDDSAAAPVAIVDESLARRYWPGEDPIGKRVRDDRSPEVPWKTVIGVVATAKHGTLDEAPTYHIYLAYDQRPQWNVYVVVRAMSDPLALVGPLRAAVGELDPNLPLYEIGTMQDALDRSLGTRRFTEVLLAGLAATALLLAAIGIYGVMSLNVTSRVREFGIRLALGAAPGAVRWLVIRRGMALAAGGVVLGVAGALWLTRFLRELLFQVSPMDPITFAAVAAVLATAALLACYLPARRATRTDPVVALRQE